MKYLKLVWLLLILHSLFNSFNVLAQDNLLIVNFQSEEYFSPIIIDILNDLYLYEGDTVKKAFDKVIVLNHLKNHISEQKDIKKLLDYFREKGVYIDLSSEGKEINEVIYKNLSNYTSLLNIKTYQIGELLEFQFSLYSNIRGSGENIMPTKDARLPDLFYSSVINPNNDDYTIKLKQGLKNIFPKANKPPVSVITINSLRNTRGKLFYFAVGDTIELSGIQSYDIDSRRNEFSYQWRRLGGDLSKHNSLSTLEYNIATNKLVPNTTGKYKYVLEVFDGIAMSEPDTVEMIIIPRPRIYIRENNISRTYQFNLFDLIRRQKEFAYCLNVASNVPQKEHSNLFIKNETGEDYLNYLDSLAIKEYSLSENINIDTLLNTINTINTKSQFIDSTVKMDGGYKIYFSGNPRTGIYRYSMLEEHQGIRSNKLDFRINYKRRGSLEIKNEYSFSKVYTPNFDSSLIQRNNYSSRLFKNNRDSIVPLENLEIFISCYLFSNLYIDVNPFLIKMISKDVDSSYVFSHILRTGFSFSTKRVMINPFFSANIFKEPAGNSWLIGMGMSFKLFYNFQISPFLDLNICYKNSSGVSASTVGLGFSGRFF